MTTKSWKVDDFQSAITIEDMIPVTGLYYIKSAERWEIWYVDNDEKPSEKTMVGFSVKSEGLVAAQDLFNQFVYLVHEGYEGVDQLAGKEHIQ